MPPKKRAQSVQVGGSKKKSKQSGPSAERGASTSVGAGPSTVWCSACSLPSTAECRAAHACVDVWTARVDVEGRLRALEATRRELDALEDKLGVKLTATASLRGEDVGDKGPVGITLAVASLSADERAAILELLEGLETYPQESYLLGNGLVLRRAAFVGLRARLPSHLAGATLRAGAILISDDVTDEDSEAEDEDCEDLSGEDAEGRESKVGSDEVRVYYNRVVKPSQASGARVLGYITTNLKLLGHAPPGGLYHLSGWGARYDRGMSVDLADVKFV